MTTYGYARVSTPNQSIARQVRNLVSYDPAMEVVEEAYTGRTTARPKFQRLLGRVAEGDVIVFDEVSRMSRDADEGFATYKALYERGVGLVFLKEPHINTSTYREAAANVIRVEAGTGDDATDRLLGDIMRAVNAYVLAIAERQVRLAFEQSQSEVDYLRQRTREGMETARMAGRQIGQVPGATLVTKKAKASKPLIMRHAKRYGGTLSSEECMRLCGISRNTYFRYCREIDEGQST